MRIFTVSDIHIDFEENLKWLNNISEHDYTGDVLIVAGDITNNFNDLNKALRLLKQRFSKVLYVPGNHDLWVYPENKYIDSITKFTDILRLSRDEGIVMEPIRLGSVSIVPLFGWYDYSFGTPVSSLTNAWADYYACKWPDTYDHSRITEYFTSLNNDSLEVKNDLIISFSHFLPRIDLMPDFIPASKRILYPVFGTDVLEKQIRILKSNIHIYGHSHLNMNIRIDDTLYVNNAYGYPYEKNITARSLVCVYEN